MVANENVVLEALMIDVAVTSDVREAVTENVLLKPSSQRLAGNLAAPLDIASGQRREGPEEVVSEKIGWITSEGAKVRRCEDAKVGWSENAKMRRSVSRMDMRRCEGRTW